MTLRLTVSELNAHLKQLMEGDETLRDVWVQGEVTALTVSSAGHVYFTLKDAGGCLGCVMWRATAARFTGRLPAQGVSVLARGYVSVYSIQGKYQLYVEDLLPLGAGTMYLELESLKQRLAAEGLFSPERKRPLPRFPRAIGVVTSPSGAALQDILRVLRGRYPLARVVVSPTLVQGDEAPSQIVEAIACLNRCCGEQQIDVIIVARGGGSREELWAFNDERVARAIAGASVPVISGVGHEIDVTVADLVADWRAPTPTAAATQAVPDSVELQTRVAAIWSELGEAVAGRLRDAAAGVQALDARLCRCTPRSRLDRDRQRIDDLTYRARLAVDNRLARLYAGLAGRRAALAGLDPHAVLNRGYAIVSRRDSGATIQSVQDATPGLALDVRVRDGSFGVQVDS